MRGESPRMETDRRPDSPRSAVERQGRRASRGHATVGVKAAAERSIAGVPARIMRPRLVFLVCLAALVGFGLLMVYSASSVEAANNYGSSTYFAGRQFAFAFAGVIGMLVIAFVIPDTWFEERPLWAFMGLMVVLLLAVKFVGRGSRGATRWLNLGFMQFQPSEFLKLFLIPLVAKLFDELYSRRVPDTRTFLIKMTIAVLPPLLLILIQPDFGTVLILVVTLTAMAMFSGIKRSTVIMFLVGIAALCGLAALLEPYRVMRMLIATNPWADEFGDGYQATLAIMAFASGGLFGRGIGNSTMKYSYLPEAHNDYILAIIGEECGFLGTLIFLLVFALLIWSAFRIAEQATSRRGALIASGSAVVLAVQFFINALGILNIIGMTGKPLPFISYGGSSMIVSLCLAGLILRTSIESARRDEYDRRRESFAVVDESTAGTPHVRGGGASRAGFTVLAGTADAAMSRGTDPTRPAPSRPTPRTRGGSGSYDRIDLNADPTARLRTYWSGLHLIMDYHDR